MSPYFPGAETNQRTITDIFTTPTVNPEEYEAEGRAWGGGGGGGGIVFFTV